MPVKSVYGGWGSPAEAVTADRTVSAFDCGKTFTNRGAAGTVTLTLPVVSAGFNGWNIKAIRLAAQSFVVATNPVDTLVISADAAADSVTLATIGHGVEIWCDGTQFYALLLPGAAATIISGATVAT
jgi:hypothetical protein